MVEMRKTEIPKNLGYITSTTKTYWCHLCQKEFSRLYIENTEVHCRACGKTFCEEVTTTETEHPSTYQPFEQPRPEPQIRENFLTNRIRARTSPLLDFFSSMMSFNNEEAQMESIINYLMANDPNKYGNPPASKEEVDKLQKVTITKDTLNEIALCKTGESCCSVCKDDYEIDQSIIKLPCSHHFHDECLLPWLKERNSCPTCRFELKTDDSDYENRKKEKK